MWFSYIHTYLYTFITAFYLYIFHFLIKELQNKCYRKYSLKCSFPNQPPPCHVIQICICYYAWCVKVFEFWRYGFMCSWWLMVSCLISVCKSCLYPTVRGWVGLTGDLCAVAQIWVHLMLGMKPWFCPTSYISIRMKNVMKGVSRLLQTMGAVL